MVGAVPSRAKAGRQESKPSTRAVILMIFFRSMIFSCVENPDQTAVTIVYSDSIHK
jgi:hypothetical protein